MNENIDEIRQINNKINKLIDKIAWFIPIKKCRDKFRNKFWSYL